MTLGLPFCPQWDRGWGHLAGIGTPDYWQGWVYHRGIKAQRLPELLPPATETVHRLMMSRCIAADVKAWAKDCPAPENWGER